MDRPSEQGPASDRALEEEPPHYLVQRVREALAHDERVAELEVKVKVFGKRVFLTGDVATKERHDAIDEVLAELLPDHDIVNETMAQPLEEPTQVETLS